MLAKKVETLTKAMEVEAKKMRREVAAMEKEVAAMRVEKEQENRANRLGNSKGPVNSSQLLPGRYVFNMIIKQSSFYSIMHNDIQVILVGSWEREIKIPSGILAIYLLPMPG